MWMMGYNEPHQNHEHFNINMVESYSINPNRKLRPLAPRPPPPNCAAVSSSSAAPSNRFHSTPHDHLLPFTHHLAEQNKRDHFNSQQMVVVSSRWNPTPEQLQTLEELYRRGTRTPSADEIQHITAQLRRYGKIEGKNVFYWFQNHKARERQKRRRQLDNHPPFLSTDTNSINLDHQPIQCKDSEVEETRNWAIPTFSEKTALRERAGKLESRMTSIAPDKAWIPVEQPQDQEQEEEQVGGGNDQVLLVHRRRKSFPARNDTWSHMMQCLSSSSSSSSTPTNHAPMNLINSTCTLTTNSASKTASSLVVSTHRQHQFTHDMECYQTLELFPVNSNGAGVGHGLEQPEKCFFPTTDVSHSPRQFIEFLPLKN